MPERPYKVGNTLLIDNGTNWPDPYVDPNELDEPARTYHLNALVMAYWHLAAHPAGTESCIASLRSLRRAVAKTTGGEG